VKSVAVSELDTICRLVPGVEGVAAYRGALRALRSESNGQLFELAEQFSLAFEAGDHSLLDADGARLLRGRRSAAGRAAQPLRRARNRADKEALTVQPRRHHLGRQPVTIVQPWVEKDIIGPRQVAAAVAPRWLHIQRHSPARRLPFEQAELLLPAQRTFRGNGAG
jgi:hypothetical protein